MKQYTKINELTFEVKKVSQETIDNMASQVIREYKLLHDCYARCSQVKEAIYNNWMEWASEVDGLYSFGIMSYNTNIFTLGGVIEDAKGNRTDVIRITPSYNYVYVAK